MAAGGQGKAGGSQGSGANTKDHGSYGKGGGGGLGGAPTGGYGGSRTPNGQRAMPGGGMSPNLHNAAWDGFHPGNQAIPGSRNTLHNISRVPPTLNNALAGLGGGLSTLTGGYGPLGPAVFGKNLFTGPFGTAQMVEHDPPGFRGTMPGGQLLNPQSAAAPMVQTGQPPIGQPPTGQLLNPRYLGIGGGRPYGVNLQYGGSA